MNFRICKCLDDLVCICMYLCVAASICVYLHAAKFLYFHALCIHCIYVCSPDDSGSAALPYIDNSTSTEGLRFRESEESWILRVALVRFRHWVNSEKKD